MTKQKELLSTTHQPTSVILEQKTSNDHYLLLSFILPESISSLHKVRKSKEVHHFSFSIYQSTENGCISVRVKIPVTRTIRLKNKPPCLMKYVPARSIRHPQHPNALPLTLIHQVIILLNLLIWSVRSHLQPVIQPATAGLKKKKRFQELIVKKI